MAYKAIIAGASGLIGSELLNILLNEPEYDEILILVRKELPIQHKKLTQLVVDFARLDDYADKINGHALFCCLGTTKKNTPDTKAYYKIDHDYPVQLAQLAAKNAVDNYHLISSLGANSASSTFYLKTKGETEHDIKQVGLKSLYIYRPSFLTGDRKEYRFAEKILIPLMHILNPLLIGGLKQYRSIPAHTVAIAMFKQSIKKQEGTFLYLSEQIKQLA